MAKREPLTVKEALQRYPGEMLQPISGSDGPHFIICQLGRKKGYRSDRVVKVPRGEYVAMGNPNEFTIGELVFNFPHHLTNHDDPDVIQLEDLPREYPDFRITEMDVSEIGQNSVICCLYRIGQSKPRKKHVEIPMALAESQLSEGRTYSSHVYRAFIDS